MIPRTAEIKPEISGSRTEEVNVNVVVTEWSPKTKIGINLLDSQLTGLTSEYLYMSLIDLIYYEYLYMSQIDQIY